MDYKVRLVNFPKLYNKLKNEIDGTISRVLEGGNFVLRKDLEEFENNISSFIGTKYAVGVNSGTDAMFLSLYAAGIKSGDEVITVAHTFVATVASIVHCGGVPILVDVGEDMNMNGDLLENVITKKTKAILPVHLNGRVCYMRKVMEVAEEHNLLVIEDAAQALGAQFEGKSAGTFGLASCWSLYPAKLLGALGDAGMVTTDDENLAQKIRFLRDHGQNRSTGEIMFFGFNSRLDNLHAAVLNTKLKHVPSWIKRRREIAQMYNEELEGLGDIIIPPKSDKQFSDTYQNYVIRTKRRDELASFLKENGIETLIQWAIPMQKQKALKLDHFILPKTEQISREVISLPMHSELEDEEVKYVIENVKNFYKN